MLFCERRLLLLGQDLAAGLIISLFHLDGILPPVVRPVNQIFCISLKVHKNENILAPILNFVGFHCQLCLNIKVL
jgi:hypothetical protein